MDLVEWAEAQSVRAPDRSDAKPKKLQLRPGSLLLPSRLSTRAIRGAPSARSPGGGAQWIESILITAESREYRALGMAFLAYALSEQAAELHIDLTAQADELTEIVIWPCTESELDKELGIRQRVQAIHYRPSLAEGNPNYTTGEQDREGYPREHLPHWRTGSLDVAGGGVTRKNEPVAAHCLGTGPSLVWMGRYFLNLALEDSNARLAYLYNIGEHGSLAWNSAELRMAVRSAVNGPQLLPPEM